MGSYITFDNSLNNGDRKGYRRKAGDFQVLYLILFVFTILSCKDKENKKETKAPEASSPAVPAIDTSLYAIIPFDEKQTGFSGTQDRWICLHKKLL